MKHAETSEVVIVGGGLVGSLLAATLAEHGYRVTVYESRPDIRHGSSEAGRSINLVLTRRGMRALGRVGLERGALELTVPVTGRMMHTASGDLAYQPYGRDDSECNYSIPRGALNEFLVHRAADRGVRFRFQTRLVEADLDQRRLTFVRSGDGDLFEVRAGVVFGTDGAGSTVRESLRLRPGFTETIDTLTHGYKELEIPPADDGGFRIERSALHIWPRGESMLMALPNLDGSFTVTLYLPIRGDRGFERIDTTDRIRRLFDDLFPDAVPLIPDLLGSFLARPTGRLGTVRFAPWNLEGSALVLGDAAHAIVPFFGQGMNSGFEDCTVLGELLGEIGRDRWAEVFAEFGRLRKPNTDAIAAMALDNFVEMRDRVGDAAFLLRKEVEHRLETEMPQQYRSRYSMVMYSHIPYETAAAAGRIQHWILDELCEGLGSAANLDLTRAQTLIGERLAPFLRRHRVSLDY